MRGLSRSWPFLIAIVVVYLAPVVFGAAYSVIAGDVPTETRAAVSRAVWVLFAFMLNPLACMVVNFLVGARLGKVWAFPIVAALLFIPVAVGELGARGLVYATLYLVFGLLGWFLGWLVHRRQAGTPSK